MNSRSHGGHARIEGLRKPQNSPRQALIPPRSHVPGSAIRNCSFLSSNRAAGPDLAMLALVPLCGDEPFPDQMAIP
jgi:hypothetical protein